MIRYSNNVIGSYEYRQFLIHNAKNIMEVNQLYTQDKIGNGSCNAVPVPFTETCDVNKSWARCSITNPNGIGLNNVVPNQKMYPV
jgi:hypothetical protein